MAQRTVNHNSISYDGPGATAITNLRAKIEAGDVVYAADINTLIGWMNSWDNHTHTYTDYYQQATFGNNGDRNNYEESKTTAKHDQDSSDIGTVTAGNLITAAKHNEMKDVANRLRAHYHVINDRTS
jgi:diphthamide biosynthesis methyltransferase